MQPGDTLKPDAGVVRRACASWGAIWHSARIFVPVLAVMGMLSGVRGLSFSLENLWREAPPVLITMGIGWFSGAGLGMLLFPWLPGRSASFKGTMAGGIGLLVWPAACGPIHLRPWDVLTALLVVPAMASFLTLTYAGGISREVEAARKRERRVTLPVQMAMAVVAVVIWIIPRFV